MLNNLAEGSAFSHAYFRGCSKSTLKFIVLSMNKILGLKLRHSNEN
jgi:hypothetical protein